METAGEVYPAKLDLTNCDREPIHIIGSSQSHGVIIACSLIDFVITQCSENSRSLLGFDVEDLLGKPITFLVPDSFPENFPTTSGKKEVLPEIDINGARFLIIAHISNQNLILDFEPLGEKRSSVNFQKQLSTILNELNSSASIEGISLKAAALVKSIFGYDRVMIYQFDEEWNGKVIAEEKEANLESWLGLHYPATDIPKPSRDLFLKQDVRIIGDVHYTPAKLTPVLSPLTGKALDLSLSELRGVSPVHLEYLKNMGVGASLTAAIVIKGKLWGLLACHHYSKKHINYYQRQSVKFLTQIYSNALALLTAQNFIDRRESYTAVRNNILSQLSSNTDFLNSLISAENSFTSLIPCSGGAVYMNGQLHLLGETPGENEILVLIYEFLNKQDVIFFTRNLEKVFEPASDYKEVASGILSVKIGDRASDLLMWFRGESATEVNWGGNPEKKSVVKEGVEYLSPRKSFKKWTQQVSGISNPWLDHEVEVVKSFREGITHVIVSKQKEEIKELNKELLILNKDLESYNYSVSHDLRAPLRGISGYASILKKRYFDSLDEDGRKYLETILQSSKEMHNLIEDLLSYSKLGKSRIKSSSVEVLALVRNILENLNVKKEYPHTTIIIHEDIPSCEGDSVLLYQLFLNLIGNALKYSVKAVQPKVEIGFEIENGEVLYFVKDNGIGMDPQFKDKIFNVFLRLAGDEYPGTGVGLATVKKVIEKHQGRIWVTTALGKGSAFYFKLNTASGTV